jgi:hypothetical protein
MKLYVPRQILEKCRNIKFHIIASIGDRVVPYGSTDGQIFGGRVVPYGSTDGQIFGDRVVPCGSTDGQIFGDRVVP